MHLPSLRQGSLAVPLLLAAAGTAAQDGIGYPTVAEARRAVTAMPGAKVSEQQGWLIVEQLPTLWSFTPAGHEAHPAAVKRTVAQREDGRVFIDMKVLCEAPKAACDRLVEGFRNLNEQTSRGAGGGR